MLKRLEGTQNIDDPKKRPEANLNFTFQVGGLKPKLLM